jgi:hypothetical protein
MDQDVNTSAKVAVEDAKKGVKKRGRKVKKILTGAAVVAAAYGAKKMYDVAKKAMDETQEMEEKVGRGE